MGFVVENDDVLLTAQLAADAADHLVRRFDERTRIASREDRLGESGRVAALVRQERVVVRDDDPRLREPLEQIRRQDVALAVVVVGVGRHELLL